MLRNGIKDQIPTISHVRAKSKLIVLVVTMQLVGNVPKMRLNVIDTDGNGGRGLRDGLPCALKALRLEAFDIDLYERGRRNRRPHHVYRGDRHDLISRSH